VCSQSLTIAKIRKSRGFKDRVVWIVLTDCLIKPREDTSRPMKTIEDKESELQLGHVFVSEDESLLEDVEEMEGFEEPQETDSLEHFDESEMVEDGCGRGVLVERFRLGVGIDDEEGDELGGGKRGSGERTRGRGGEKL
jgi:hypothetical protein